jgi:hypothetical protein
MVGRPETRAREKLAGAEAERDAAAKRLDGVLAALLLDGIDPARYDPEIAKRAPPRLERYAPALPMQVARLADMGQSIEEIRVSLGFTDAQESEWRQRYVDFDAAVSRVRAREEAYWQRQARKMADGGDRASLTAITSLIQKRFIDSGSRGNAADLVHVHLGSRLHKPDSEGS